MPLNAGNVNEPAPPTPDERSMAQAIADAFRNLWPIVMGDQPVPEDTPETRLLFTAIAQGVITHLKDNPDAFKVSVTLPNNTIATGEVDEIIVVSNDGE